MDIFYTEAQGGHLAVNAFGNSSSTTTSVFGAHIGLAWPGNIRLFSPLAPALELEGFYVGKASLKGAALNDTDRLAESNFEDTYHLKTGVLLANAVFNVDHARLGPKTSYAELSGRDDKI